MYQRVLESLYGQMLYYVDPSRGAAGVFKLTRRTVRCKPTTGSGSCQEEQYVREARPYMRYIRDAAPKLEWCWTGFYCPRSKKIPHQINALAARRIPDRPVTSCWFWGTHELSQISVISSSAQVSSNLGDTFGGSLVFTEDLGLSPASVRITDYDSGNLRC